MGYLSARGWRTLIAVVAVAAVVVFFVTRGL